jgi:hypothetical protein
MQKKNQKNGQIPKIALTLMLIFVTIFIILKKIRAAHLPVESRLFDLILTASFLCFASLIFIMDSLCLAIFEKKKISALQSIMLLLSILSALSELLFYVPFGFSDTTLLYIDNILSVIFILSSVFGLGVLFSCILSALRENQSKNNDKQ